jgi:hypothetical protein
MQVVSCVARAPRVVVMTCLFVHGGCAAVDGGAVELSWSLRTASGSTSSFATCDPGHSNSVPVTGIRLDWEVGGVAAFKTWDCVDGYGVTGFELPEGPALLSVSPTCEFGAATTNTYTAPAPEQRKVIAGNTISLGAVELILQTATKLDPSCELQPCICQ